MVDCIARLLIVIVLASHVAWPVHAFTAHTGLQHQIEHGSSAGAEQGNLDDSGRTADHCGHLSAHVIAFVATPPDIGGPVKTPKPNPAITPLISRSTTPPFHPPKIRPIV